MNSPLKLFLAITIPFGIFTETVLAASARQVHFEHLDIRSGNSENVIEALASSARHKGMLLSSITINPVIKERKGENPIIIAATSNSTKAPHNPLADHTAPEYIALSLNPIDWAKDSWNAIKKGAKWLYKRGDRLVVGAFERGLDFARKLPSRLKKLGNDHIELLKAVGSGDLKKAAKAYGRILVDYVDLSGSPEALDLLMEQLKLNTRQLSSKEIEIARSVFGNSINYSVVRVDELSLLVASRKLITGGDDAPFTTFNTINSLGGMTDDGLIHELTHIWQYQHIGSIYAPEAVISQVSEGRHEAYDYGGITKLQALVDEGQGITKFNLEQQAAIAQDYYLLTKGNQAKYDPSAQPSHLPIYAYFVKQFSGSRSNSEAHGIRSIRRGALAPPVKGVAPSACIDGYVWREAVPNDHVCVLPAIRDQVAEDNAQAEARRSPTGGDYGPDTCIDGYVWREANHGLAVNFQDHVCVLPETRERTWNENLQADQHRATQ